MRKIPRNIELALKTFLPLLGLVILSVFVVKFGIGKISEVRTKIAQAKSDSGVLENKLSLLRELSSSVGTSSNLALTALPSENPVLLVLSQLKLVASQNGVLVENIKSGGASKDETGLDRVDLTFDVEGVRPQVILFLSSIAQIAPISLVDRVKLNETQGTTRATVTVRAFWSDLPTKLPEVTKQLTDLTPDEKKILVSVANLIQPQFVKIPATSGAGKTDPF